MKTAQHTPGPWVLKRRAKPFHGVANIRDSAGRRICSFTAHRNHAGYCNAEHEANARLIAAAPETAAERDRLKAINAELLEACKAVVERSEGKLYNTDQETGETFVNLLLNAIAKANGE